MLARTESVPTFVDKGLIHANIPTEKDNNIIDGYFQYLTTRRWGCEILFFESTVFFEGLDRDAIRITPSKYGEASEQRPVSRTSPLRRTKGYGCC